MLNKKGFTLVEIIISLTLIILIGGTVISVVLTKNNEKEKNIAEVTKKIQEAANVYFSINKELDGTIEQNIYNGASGYIIQLNTLLEEGYINDSYIDTLEKNIDDFKREEHYMLMAEFAKNKTECDAEGKVLEITASWIKNENLLHSGAYYICNYENKSNEYHYLFLDTNGGNLTDDRVYIKESSEPITIATLPTPTKNGYEFKGWFEGNTQITSVDLIGTDSKTLEAKWEEPKTIYNEIKDRYKKEGISGCIPGVTTGLCMIKGNGITENGKEVYYFAGNQTTNNYIKINNKLYYIIRTTEDENIKLVRTDKYSARLNFTSTNTNFQNTFGTAPYYIKVSNEDIGISLATKNSSFTSGEKYFNLGGMLNIESINGDYRSNGANTYEASDSNNACSTATSNTTWKDSQLCSVNWCFKRWGGAGNSCSSSTRYTASFYSPMHSIYLDTRTSVNNSGINYNFLATTKWCTNSKYNRSKVRSYCRDDKCFTVFPAVNLTCEESDYIESNFGLLNKAEYFLVTHFTESTYDLHAGSLDLYGISSNFEATIDNTYSFDIVGRTYYFTHGNTENQLVYRPAVTIKGTLKITAGDGSQTSPYRLSL